MSNIIFTIIENKIYDENKCNETDYIEYVNYTTKQLNYILQYYNIANGRMCKDDMIQSIILFENDISNLDSKLEHTNSDNRK